ncbi:MAG: hypothetical protein WAU02_01395 [Candidatus Saccharimonadales bacterium]
MSTTGSTAWTTPANAQLSDTVYAAASVAKGIDSHYLQCVGYGFTIPAGATINGVTARVKRMVPSNNSQPNDKAIYLVINGTVGGTNQSAGAAWTMTDTTVTFGSTSNLWGSALTSTVVNATNFGFAVSYNATKNNTSGSIDYMDMDVTYSYNATFDQAGYQWYTNTDSTATGQPVGVGAALGGVAQNTAAFSLTNKQIFRLRMLLHVTGDVAPPSGYSFKLQYAVRGTDNSCDTAWTGETYGDVGTATTAAISYANNPNAADGDSLATSASPTHGSGPDTRVLQEYNEANNTTVKNSILGGQDGIWDFALQDNTSTYGAVYCFRMTTDTGGLLTTYTQIPTLATPVGTGSATFVDNAGTSIAPQFSMSIKSLLPSCQTSTGTLGASGGNKLRITQDGNAGAAGWSVSIAATSGSTALWYASGTGPYYDFNDSAGSPPGCAAGSDGDTYAGQLSINKSTSVLTAQSGCATTGVTTGATTDNFTSSTPITLASLSSAAQANCYWDLYGTTFSQTIPANQAAGSYLFDLTVTWTSP